MFSIFGVDAIIFRKYFEGWGIRSVDNFFGGVDARFVFQIGSSADSHKSMGINELWEERPVVFENLFSIHGKICFSDLKQEFESIRRIAESFFAVEYMGLIRRIRFSD